MIKRAVDGNGMILGNPNQTGIIGASCMLGKVPVLDIPEPCGMSIEKSELCAAVVEIGMHVVLLGHGGEFAIIE
jgi:hypothetical protein